MTDTYFVAVDWGTSGFRLWVIGRDGSVLDSTTAPLGMSRLKRNDFDRVLEESLDKLGIAQDVPAIICGMAGAAQGWCEAPYLCAPTRLDALGEGAVSVRGATRNVHILPGVKQMAPANVMRGEETQIAGLLHAEPSFAGTVCLPGTHTKWVQVKDGAIQHFETCMTGEQFAFFSQTSVLSHSMILDGWSDNAFRSAVRLATQDPVAVPRRLFSIRADMLVRDQDSATARATLSGLLIGQELMSVVHYWRDQSVTLIGAPPLCEIYLMALDFLGVGGRSLDVETTTLAGLAAAFHIQTGTVHA
ncbi:2-dehydro-3-deoxygalactonokinase [Leisingera sp. S232]|uniref:2-dehydro-3-deoxygalactonokinase n=1 Tax=Leisingera sp. S232 TaxID=3415132 RepID=UPI003C7B65A8